MRTSVSGSAVGPLVVVTYHGDQLPDEIDWPLMFAGVIAAGGIPLALDCAQPVEAERILRMAQGVILLGGGDVDPGEYGAQADETLMDVSAARDVAERALITEARRRGLPILGICRGMQMLNVALGGTLIMHVPRDRPSDIHHGPGLACLSQAAHAVTLVEGARPSLWMADADAADVNSEHHQGIDRLGEGLSATAHADDGLIEAYQSDDGLLVGVQWHPEFLWQTSEPARQLLEGFIATCARHPRGGQRH